MHAYAHARAIDRDRRIDSFPVFDRRSSSHHARSSKFRGVDAISVVMPTDLAHAYAALKSGRAIGRLCRDLIFFWSTQTSLF